ncbi:tetratricopeptide repeat protein [Kocuria sp. ZOR0020]|uniref:tetratricopeptide repeat protein n=1 Tax=Kocuria sp. ZOR0020 TaxID=1339234 RepID=UPI0006485071|nr:tetratricopeptide repeat protein [Kocuria sp. ZOR0020]
MNDHTWSAGESSWEHRVTQFWETVDLSDRQGAVAGMAALVAERPNEDPDAHFEMGCVYDSTGFEAEAAREYQTARGLGLSGARLERLNIQQASTLRNLGRVDEAIAMLEAAEPHPAIGDARAVFLGLALHDAGRHGEALRVVLEALIPDLPRYQRSVTAYARALTDEQ